MNNFYIPEYQLKTFTKNLVERTENKVISEAHLEHIYNLLSHPEIQALPKLYYHYTHEEYDYGFGWYPTLWNDEQDYNGMIVHYDRYDSELKVRKFSNNDIEFTAEGDFVICLSAEDYILKCTKLGKLVYE